MGIISKFVEISSVPVEISSAPVEISSVPVEISSAPVEISSELVEISSELVWLIWKLLIISVFIRTRNAVMRRYIPLAHVCSTEFWVFAFIR